MSPEAVHRLPGLLRLEPDRAWRWTRALLGLGFGFLLFLLAAMTWLAPHLLWIPPVLLVGSVTAVYLGRSEVGLLVALLATFVVVVGHKEGFQVEEAIYGMAYLGYLTYWFISRLFYYQDDVLATRTDRALFGFLVWVTMSFGLTVLFRGNLSAMLSEWLSISMLAFYFPVKEVCRRDDRAPRLILIALAGVAIFVVVRNVLEYRTELSSATALWQIATGRVVENEHVLMMMGLTALVFVLYAVRTRTRAAALLAFLVFVSGVIIGQSRAVWVSFALGGLVIFLLTDRKRRLSLVWYGLAGLTTVLVVGAVAFPEFFSLIVAGLLDRFLSLESAATRDLSLINRFVEMGAAWQYIRVNPIVGYGFGVPIEYYSLVYELSYRTSFIHNGPIGIWYRHGLIGFGLVYTFYFGSLIRGVRLARKGTGIYLPIGLAVAAALTAEALLGNTENSFATSDKALMIGVLAGLVAAGTARLAAHPPEGRN